MWRHTYARKSGWPWAMFSKCGDCTTSQCSQSFIWSLHDFWWRAELIEACGARSAIVEQRDFIWRTAHIDGVRLCAMRYGDGVALYGGQDAATCCVARVRSAVKRSTVHRFALSALLAVLLSTHLSAQGDDEWSRWTSGRYRITPGD